MREALILLSLFLGTGAFVLMVFLIFLAGIDKIVDLSRENARCRQEIEFLCKEIDRLPATSVYEICLKLKEVKP